MVEVEVEYGRGQGGPIVFYPILLTSAKFYLQVGGI
jgi:hypothetical protein